MPDEITWDEMGREVHSNQSVLFARTAYGYCPILTSRGDLVTQEIDSHSNCLDDHSLDNDLGALSLGLHIWEGTLTLSGGGGEFHHEVDLFWNGRIRRATAADLDAFGLALEVNSHGG